jgi:plastocyanin
MPHMLTTPRLPGGQTGGASAKKIACRRASRAVALFIAAATPLLGFSGAQAQSSAEAATPGVIAREVRIDNFTFSPPMLTVPAGTTVTWRNADDIPHTIVAKDRSFRSKALDTDDRFSFTFTAPGDYDYFCSLHPHMTGRVVVTN